MTFILHYDRYFCCKDVYLCHIVFSCVCKLSLDVAIRTPFTYSMQLHHVVIGSRRFEKRNAFNLKG